MNKKTTFLSLKCLFVLAFTQVLHAQQIYTNGPLSTGATSNSGVAAPAGYTWSELQNVTGTTTETNGTLGSNAWYNTAAVSTFKLTDDFTVPAGAVWNVTSFEFYAYQTNSAATPAPFDELRVQIFNGIPGAAGTTSVAGNMTANVIDLANTTDALMYRIANSSNPSPGVVPGTTRRLWKLRGNLSVSLPAGAYWVVYQIHSTNNLSCLSPFVTVPGVRTQAGWNARQQISATAAWTDILDVGNPGSAADVACAIPFNVNGTVAPANDACSGALAATALPYSHVQTLGNLSTNNGGFLSGTCTTVAGMNDGLWYSFVGDGSSVTVAVTGVDATFDPQVDVYTGACGAFTGCGGSEDVGLSGGNETVVVATTLGTTYYVNVGDYNTGTDQPEGNFTINITGGLSNSAFENENFRAYPNPVTDVLNLSYSKDISSVAVYNMLGQEVMVRTVNAAQSQLDMSQLAKGTYLVKVLADNQEKTIKVVKN